MSVQGMKGVCSDGSCGSASVRPERKSRAQQLNVCHPSIVEQTCRRWSGDDKANAETNTTTIKLLAEDLSENCSALEKLFEAMNFGTPPWMEINCSDLCISVKNYLVKLKVKVPQYSDQGCYTQDNETECNINVSQRDVVKTQLVEGNVTTDEDQPQVDQGPVYVHSKDSNESTTLMLLQHRFLSTGTSIKRETRAVAEFTSPSPTGGTSKQPLSESLPEKLAVYIITRFRVYTDLATVGNTFTMSVDKNKNVGGSSHPLSVKDPTYNEKAVKEKIANMRLQAVAWADAVTGEMEDHHTVFYLIKWFGGPGDLPSQELRKSVLRTMNFAMRELHEGIHFVFPADDHKDTACSHEHQVVAYVYKVVNSEKVGYFETEGPICNATDNPLEKACAIDPEGKYFVYLCRFWYDVRDSMKIRTLVHEAIHHAGPRDVAYDQKKIRNLNQSSQLDNAANYERFAQDVAHAAWGCPDVKRVVLPHDDESYTCAEVSADCGSAIIWSQCPATCGACNKVNEHKTATATASTSAKPQLTTHGVVCLGSIVLLCGFASRNMMP